MSASAPSSRGLVPALSNLMGQTKEPVFTARASGVQVHASPSDVAPALITQFCVGRLYRFVQCELGTLWAMLHIRKSRYVELRGRGRGRGATGPWIKMQICILINLAGTTMRLLRARCNSDYLEVNGVDAKTPFASSAVFGF